MKTFDFYKDETLKKLKNDLNYYKIQVEWLKKIKRKTKKNWTNFQNFLQNFECWEGVGIWYWILEYVKIYYQGEHVEIQQYTIDEEFIKNVDSSRVVHETYLKDRVYYTPDEFMEQIKKQIERREEAINELESSIDNFEDTTKQLEAMLEPIWEFITKLPSQNYKFKELASKSIEHYTNY